MTRSTREGVEVYLYYFFKFGARWGLGDQRHAPADLTQGKTWYRLYMRLVGHQSWSGPLRKTSPPLGFDPRTAQSVSLRTGRTMKMMVFRQKHY
jgi:hypothetical protein